MTKRDQQEQQANAIAKLREIIRPGDTVWTILRHRSRSGMQRRISCVIMWDRQPTVIDWLVARALGYRVHPDGGLVVGGCGMDMGYHLAYNLSRVLFDGTFECIGERCPSNDHTNGDRNHSPDHMHSDGGYALRHQWL